MDRSRSVDIVRLIAVIAVIVIHVQPFTILAAVSQLYEYLFVIFSQAARFAVPFFFVISGYYWGKRIRSGSPISAVSGKALSRIILLFVVWSLVYLLPHDARTMNLTDPGSILPDIHSKLDTLFNDPVALAFQGTTVHLWFLTSLACAIVVASLFLLAGAGTLLPAIAVVLYLLGVAAKSYAATPVGIDLLGGFNTRNGPFFSTLFFVTGYYLSDRTPTPQWMRVGLLVFLGGLVVHFSEVIFLLLQYLVPAARLDYVLGTYFLGLGAAMVALSGHRSLQNAHLAAFGGLTLGIYCIHILFLKMIPQFYAPRTNPVLEIALVFIVLALSAGACYLLSKVPYLRRLVV